MPATAETWLAGGGEMGELIRAHDWAASPLGPIETWPQSLCTAVGMILAAPVPMWVGWGGELIQLYNDAYAGFLDGKHAEVLGQPAARAWADIWHMVGPDLGSVLAGGAAVSHADRHVRYGLGGEPRDRYLTYSYSPVPEPMAPNRIGGVLGIAIDTTIAVEHRAAEDQQTFLLELSDVLRPVADPTEVMAVAAERLGRHLGVGRCGYAEIDAAQEVAYIARDWTDGSMASAVGAHRVADFGAAFVADFRAGRAVRLDDALADPRMDSAEAAASTTVGGMRARMTVPLVKNGRFVAAFFVHNAAPRHWTDDEEALIREVAERTWSAVEQARAEAALRASEARFRTLFEAIDEGVYFVRAIFDGDGCCTDLFYEDENAAAARMTGLPLKGRRMNEAATGEQHWRDVFGRVAQTGEPQRMERFSPPDGRWYDIYAFKPPHADPDELAVVFRDVTERRRYEATLEASEERLRLAIDVGRLGTWDWNLETGEVAWSDEHYRMQGYAVGEVTPSFDAFAARVHPDDLDATIAALDAARDQRRGYVSEFRSRLPDGTIRWISAVGRFFYNDAGRPIRMIGVMEDVTEARRAREHERLLVAELQHRVRNTLAVVRGIARRTAENSDTVEDFAMHLDGRLGAFARTQAYATRNPGRGIDLTTIIVDELAAHGAREGEQVSLHGPAVSLRPGAADKIGLALHELATNAVKHGALGAPEGTVDIAWRIEGKDEQRALVFEWREHKPDGGVAKPERRGFGNDLLERTLVYELDAEARMSFLPYGFRCSVTIPLKNISWPREAGE